MRQLVDAEASDTLYLEATGLTASDGVCIIGGADFHETTYIGYVGPYVSAGGNTCGVLFTLDSDVLFGR